MIVVFLKTLIDRVNPKMAAYSGNEIISIVRRQAMQFTPGRKRQDLNNMFKQPTRRLNITSPAFPSEGEIPTIYTCDGANFNPSLLVEAVPEEAKSLALIMEDPDAVNDGFDHWVVWNIPVGPIQIDSQAGICGLNGKGTTGYHGPCSSNGLHRYIFNVFALDTLLSLPQGSTKKDLIAAMDTHILSSGSLIGKYQKAPEYKKAGYHHSQYK